MLNDTHIVTETLNAQNAACPEGVLQPGQEGYWQLWGAKVMDISEGDLIMVRWLNEDDSVKITEHQVKSVDHSTSWCPAIVDQDGQSFRVGIAQRFTLLRKDTRNRLSNHCR